jgi:hypothetical protein
MAYDVIQVYYAYSFFRRVNYSLRGWSNYFHVCIWEGSSWDPNTTFTELGWGLVFTVELGTEREAFKRVNPYRRFLLTSHLTFSSLVLT